MDEIGLTEDLRPLHKLIAAVVAIRGVSIDGRVDYITPPTPEQAAKVAQIIADWPATRDALIAAKEAERIAGEAGKQDLRDRFVLAVTRLDDIVTNGGTYTNVQVRTAVIDIAQIQRAMLKALRRML